MTLFSRLRFLWLTLAVVFLDRATKAWIESRPADRFPHAVIQNFFYLVDSRNPGIAFSFRSEEHTSELQSRENLVCRLLLEKKKIIECELLYNMHYHTRTTDFSCV